MEQPAQGFSAAQAKPLAVATPMQPSKGTGPRRHGDEIHLGGGEAAGLQQVPGHGQQGLAVGQAGVEEGLGQEGFVLAQGHGGRRGGGFQG